MSIIAWLVVGAIAGYVANWLFGTRNGLIMTVAFGVVGAIVGGMIGAFVKNGTLDFNSVLTGFDLYSVIVAILGAIALGAVGAWWGRRRAV